MLGGGWFRFPRFKTLWILIPVLPALLVFMLFRTCAVPTRPYSSGKATPPSFNEHMEVVDTLLQDAEDHQKIITELKRAEKVAISIESHLSLLKRYRALAKVDSVFTGAFQAALKRSLERFPHSSAIAVLAAAYLEHDATETELRTYATLAREGGYTKAALGLYILAGALETPVKAQEIMGMETLLLDSLSGLDQAAVYRTKGVLLCLLAGDLEKAIKLAKEGPLVEPLGEAPLAALFSYDYGTNALAVEFTKGSETSASLSLAADAYYLAGEEEEAIELWQRLGDQKGVSYDPQYAGTAVYNIASCSKSPDLEQAALDRLAKHTSPFPYGVIKVSRTMARDEALTYLEDFIAHQGDPYVELELLRRKRARLGMDWAVGELWMIYNRHSNVKAVYEYGAFLFASYGKYEELALLLKLAKEKGIRSDVLTLQHAIWAMSRAALQEAEELLASIISGEVPWQGAANLALIKELHRDYTAALSYYELALSMTTDDRDASSLLVNISRCFIALGKSSDARRSLEYALDLDPTNLEASLGLKKTRL